jgi:NitT/TauT family transport system substrate-binding protein
MIDRTVCRPASVGILATSLAWCFSGLFAGCHQNGGTPSKPAGPAKVRVAYIGLTCEAPIFVAQENGYFTEEGLDVELVRTDWDSLRDGLGLGRFDANHTLIMYLLKPIEQGLDVKITAGMHMGCLRVQTGVTTAVKTVDDLKGKRIGIPTMGSPPFLFASRALASRGLDPKKDVTWLTVSPDVMELALENGQVDAIANSEPIGSILLARNKVRTIVDQATDAPYKDEFCCAAVVSGQFAKRDPERAAKVTRALLKGAKWVGSNPTSSARLSVEKKYIASSIEINVEAMSHLKYVPGVTQCQTSVSQAAREMKLAGLLNPSTNPKELATRAWLALDGVSDEWVTSLKIEKIAEFGRPPKLDAATIALLMKGGNWCCPDGSRAR